MNIEWLKNKSKEKFYPISHSDSVLCGENADKTLTDTLQELTDNIPSKVSELENDSGYKTTDTTYTLTKEGNTVTFTGSDGYTTSFEVGSGGGATGDVTLADLGITVTAEEINKLDGVTNNIQSDISTLTDHSTNTNVHVTTEEKTAWNKNTTDIVTLTEHSTNTDVHVTTEDKEAWNKNTTDIENITNGTTVVAEATKATSDGDGNNITETYSTKTYTQTYVAEQIAGASHLTREIVTEIPTTETAKDNVIYMYKVESSTGSDVYQEYQLINGEVVLVGDTSVDLSGYLPLTSSAPSIISVPGATTMAVENIDGTANVIQYRGNGNNLGGLGFNAIDNPVYYTTTGESKDILHAGNYDDYAVPNTGGNITGNVNLVGDSSSSRVLRITNDNRYIDTMINPDGSYQVYDGTNSKDIITSSAEGVNTFYGTATGNVLLNGNGVQTIQAYATTPIHVNNAHESNDGSYVGYQRSGSVYGYLGFSGLDTPAIWTNNLGVKTILHEGNYSNYALPLTGGVIDNGDTTFLSMNADSLVRLTINTDTRTIWHQVDEAGRYKIVDSTNSTEIINSAADGTNTFYGTATGNLVLSGGTLTGTLIVKSHINAQSDEATSIQINLSNSVRRVYQEILPGGTYYLYDGTNDKAIIRSESDGTTSFNGTATGNLALDGGGTVDGSIILYSDESVNRYARVRNGLRSVDIAVYDTGSFKIFDYTNNVEIIDSLLDGTTYFNGTSTYSKMLSGSYGSDVGITAVPGTNGVRHVGSISADTEGLFPHSSNANSILTLNRHDGDFNSQLGFSSDSNVYYRHSTSADWKTILDSSNFGSYALPLIGGSAVGNIGVIRDTLAAFIVNNNTRQARFVADGNNVGIYDIDNSKWLIVSDADGVGTFNGTATGNLALDGGGTVNGNVTLSASNTTSRALTITNSVRKIHHQIIEDGRYRIADITNDKEIISSTVDGTTTFYGTATGNLPLTGGEIVSTLTTPITINSTSADYMTMMRFSKSNTVLGHLGFYTVDKPCFIDAASTKVRYLIHEDNISDSTYLATSSKHGTMSSNDKAKLDSIGGVITVQKSLTITTDWIDTGISGADLSSGSYVVQVSGMSVDATDSYYVTWTGFMTWYAGNTNDNDYDEIILHKTGHAANGTIYLRTVSQPTSGDTTGYVKLQICASKEYSETPITFKFRKLI